jgi:hypothetical protein
MKVIIVGGGIGGLTSALMLHARGIDCEVYEQSDAIRELGVGINTLPHAIKELSELGLLDRLDAVGIRTYELSTPTASGRRSGASCAAPMPATRCRNSPSIAAGCRRSSTRRYAPGSASRASITAIASDIFARMKAA